MFNTNFLHLTRDLRITLVLGLTSRSMKSSSARNIVQYDLLVGYGWWCSRHMCSAPPKTTLLSCSVLTTLQDQNLIIHTLKWLHSVSQNNNTVVVTELRHGKGKCFLLSYTVLTFVWLNVLCYQVYSLCNLTALQIKHNFQEGVNAQCLLNLSNVEQIDTNLEEAYCSAMELWPIIQTAASLVK